VAQYRSRNWIIPHHIMLSIDIAKKLCLKYNGNYQICKVALLLHDTGLIYKRDIKSPIGHEERSIEFAKEILEKLEIEEDIILQILLCINATDPSFEPKNINQKIVRSADALSQFESVHFFAKAYFYEDLDFFMNWFKKKIDKNFIKICFEEEKTKLIPIIDYYKKILDQYIEYSKKDYK
jgi:HD superfamily phosphodiesterase